MQQFLQLAGMTKGFLNNVFQVHSSVQYTMVWVFFGGGIIPATVGFSPKEENEAELCSGVLILPSTPDHAVENKEHI